MPTPFSDAEYADRIDQVRENMRHRDLSALILFAQESLYYLFGYDGGGYVFFQCAVLTLDDRPTTLLCRRPDVAQARDTSSIKDIQVWENAEDADPAGALADILRQCALGGERVGIELDNFGLTGANHAAVEKALTGVCDLEDASDVVRGLRLIKSDAELDLVRKAARLADNAVEAVQAGARPGVLDSKLTAAAMTAILEGGGDMPPAGPLVNSGRRSLYGRGVGGPRALSDSDQVIVELAGTFRRYNACIERTILVGPPEPVQTQLLSLVKGTLEEMLAAIRPDRPLGEIDEIHRNNLDAAGYADQRYAACGYSLGATYRPSWMDVPPMIYSGNPLIMRPGMVFFPHVMLGDAAAGLGIGLGQTIIVTADGCEVLSQLPLDMRATPA